VNFDDEGMLLNMKDDEDERQSTVKSKPLIAKLTFSEKL
jgi:hypothetical protein